MRLLDVRSSTVCTAGSAGWFEFNVTRVCPLPTTTTVCERATGDVDYPCESFSLTPEMALGGDRVADLRPPMSGNLEVSRLTAGRNHAAYPETRPAIVVTGFEPQETFGSTSRCSSSFV